MSIRGVWQLLRLNVNYCDHSGSSKHIRAFINSGLTEYAAQYPHAEVTSTVRRGRHPHVIGEFRNGNTKTVDLRNVQEEQIKFHMHYMFSEKGKKGGGSVKHGRKFTVNESVQGPWRPGMWDEAKGADAAAVKGAE
jgi:large subunit ribosomal protein L43